MHGGRFLALLAMAGGLLLAAGLDRAQAVETASQSLELPDEIIDAMLQKDQRGLPGSGERVRLLAELHPEFYAEMRQLARRLAFGSRANAAVLSSELEDLNGRIVTWLSGEVRRAPPRALDAILSAIRARLPAIEKADPKLCGAYTWAQRSERMQLGQVLPAAVLAIDLAHYKAAAAARTVPTRYKTPDEATWASFKEALETNGTSVEQIAPVFDGHARAALTPTERCDLERRFIHGLANVPDEPRSVILSFVLSGAGNAGD